MDPVTRDTHFYKACFIPHSLADVDMNFGPAVVHSTVSVENAKLALPACLQPATALLTHCVDV